MTIIIIIITNHNSLYVFCLQRLFIQRSVFVILYSLFHHHHHHPRRLRSQFVTYFKLPSIPYVCSLLHDEYMCYGG